MRKLLFVVAILGVSIGMGFVLVQALLPHFAVENALKAPSHAERVKQLEALSGDRVDDLVDRFLDPETEFEHSRALAEVLMNRYGRLIMLNEALDSDVATVGRVAAYTLAAKRQELNRDRILEVLREWANDDGSKYHMLCVTALRESFPGEESVDALVAIFRNAPSSGARMQAGNQLLMLTRRSKIDAKKHAKLLPTLLEVAASTDNAGVVPLVRARAFQVFVALGGRDDAVLKQLARDDESMCRQITAHVLGFLPLDQVEPILRELLVDHSEVVRRAAVDALHKIGTSDLITEWAPRLREDSFSGVRRDISQVIQSNGVETDVAIRSLVLGLLDVEPDPHHFVWRASLEALERLTKKHYGFPAEMFDAKLAAAERYRAVEEGYAGWANKSPAERRAELQPWFADYGEPARRPVLLGQLDHADPKCAAWAVLELHGMTPDAPTPGFDGGLVTAVVENRDTMGQPFLKLVAAVGAHRNDGSWAAHVAAWKKAYQ